MTTSELTQRIFTMLMETKSTLRHWEHDAVTGRMPSSNEIKECGANLYWEVRQCHDLPHFNPVINVVSELVAPLNRLNSTSSENVRRKSVSAIVMAINIVFIYCDGVSVVLDPEAKESAA
jgi:hypothetical protein